MRAILSPARNLRIPCSLTGNEKARKSKKDHSGLEYKCLVRATDGKRKFSTTLSGKELGRFKDSFDTILKVGCPPCEIVHVVHVLVCGISLLQ